MIMLHKKGDRRDPSNYRGIALVNHTVKIFTQIMADRLYAWSVEHNILPEEQNGFRPGRGCLDNIFTLNTAIQLQLRLPRRKVYVLFIDFARAFDSVKHHLLWSKMHKFGISALFINIIKSLYDNASLRVVTDKGLTENIEITEGVLQGEVLSPLAFNIYISDMPLFLSAAGNCGIPINGFVDLKISLYADDSTGFASSGVHLSRFLIQLEEYCDLNKLTVNVKKTKIMIFRNGGKLSGNESKRFKYKSEYIEVINKFTYLGVTLSSSSLGCIAAKDAVHKGKVAAIDIISILRRLKANSWSSVNKLFRSLVTSVVLYSSACWGLNYLDLIESVQLFFFKRFLNLVPNTQSSALRLELDLLPLAYNVIKAALYWIVKISKMEDSRLPKICFNRILALSNNENIPVDIKFNWIDSLKIILAPLGCDYIWKNLNTNTLANWVPDCLERYSMYLRQIDEGNYTDSSSCIFYFDSLRFDDCRFKATIENCIFLFRPLIQLRLANIYRTSLFVESTCHKFDYNNFCFLCNENNEDSIVHFLFFCPALSDLRNKYCRFCTSDYSELNIAAIALLDSDKKADLFDLYAYVTKALRLRSLYWNNWKLLIMKIFEINCSKYIS